MSTLNESDVPQIAYQDDVDARPLRVIHANLKNAINDNQTQITNLATPASGSEVVNARNNMTSLKANIELRRAFRNRIAEANDFAVTANTPAGATVLVAAGDGIVNGIGVTKTSQSTSGTISPCAAGKTRIDAVVIQSDNTLAIVAGGEVAADPTFPSIATSQMVLAHFTLTDAAVVINQSDITDDRIQVIDPFVEFENYNATYTYNADDTIDTKVVTDKNGVDYTFQYSYTSAGLLDTIVVTVGTETYTVDYDYDASDRVTSKTITIT